MCARTTSAIVLSLGIVAALASVGHAAGSVISQGDRIHRADVARSVFGVSGVGKRIGVISGGITGLDQAKTTGDLPPGACGPQVGGVTTIDPALCRGIGIGVDGEGDAEGTALMEIVHDLAPGTELLFCTPRTSLDMVACITFLAGVADVIVDDLLFFTAPSFEDGVVATAAADAVGAGRVYISAAGNDAQRHYQGLFVDSNDGQGSHLIKTGNAAFNVKGDPLRVVLQWTNPFGQAADDYDLCLASETPAACAMFNTQQSGGDDPIEIAVFNCSAGCPVQVRRVSGNVQMFELFVFGTLAPADNLAGDSVTGHAAASGVLAVAAISAKDPGNDTVERFSSRGPSTIEFPAENVRPKPDVAAVDGVSVTGAGGFPKTFFGTSAAAPHVAAIAALMLEANPALTPANVQDIVHHGAVPLGVPIPNSRSGWGRADAVNAVLGALGIMPLSIEAASALPDAELGLAYTGSVGITGGGQPVVVSLKKGTPPAGLGLMPDGSVAGVPTKTGTARFTVAAIDSFGFEEDKAFSLKVLAAVSVATAALSTGQIGHTYTMTVRPKGGKGPFVWALTGGAVPNGVVLDSTTGRLSGVPTELGTFTPTLQVTDALGAASARVFTLVIKP